ncbi:MAG: hypothetical protein U1E62_09840 [Alsobacter sp.]
MLRLSVHGNNRAVLAVARYLAEALGRRLLTFVGAKLSRTACHVTTAHACSPLKIGHGAATVMAMPECYAPCLLPWRVLSCAANAFMTVEDQDAVGLVNRLAWPAIGDPPFVEGESGEAGLAGAIRAASSPAIRTALRLDATSRVLVFSAESATVPDLYRQLVGHSPDEVSVGQGAATS